MRFVKEVAVMCVQVSRWLWTTAALPFSLGVLLATGACAPALAQSSEIIVDNADSNTARVGRWWVSSGKDPWGPDSLYNPDNTSEFYWYPEVPEAGEYSVYAYWTYYSTRSNQVPFYITHADGTARIVMNMRDQLFASRWNLLGSFRFEQPGPQEIWVSGENGQACADAIKLVPAGGGGPGEILGYYSAPAVYETITQGNYGSVLSHCAPGDYVVSGSWGVTPQTIHGDTAEFYFRIQGEHIVIDGATGIEAWAFSGVNESSVPIDAKIYVSARCADVAN
jgi:hypothetical protein